MENARELLTVQALTTLLVLRRDRMLAALLALVSPARRDKTEQVLRKIGERIGAYVRAKVIVMVIVGGLMYVALVALRVPFAVPLAVIVAFGEIVPQIGPWIARVPLLGVCLGHQAIGACHGAVVERQLACAGLRMARVLNDAGLATLLLDLLEHYPRRYARRGELTALSELPVVFVWTHDSIAVGEDGPEGDDEGGVGGEVLAERRV